MALKAEHLAIDKFDGKNYTNWRSRFKAKLAMINEEYDWLFDHFEKFDRPIIDDDFKNDQTGEIDKARIKLSKDLKGLILIHVSYELDSVLQADSTKHGFELWRRLRDRYGQVTDLSSVGRLTRITSTKFDEKSLESDLIKWEHEISLYEMETKSTLPDAIKTAHLINNTTGNLQEWIRLNASTAKGYQALRDNVVSYARSRAFASTTASGTPSVAERAVRAPRQHPHH